MQISKSHLCPFNEAPGRYPFPGSIGSCQHFRNGVYCPHFREMRDAGKIYPKAIAILKMQPDYKQTAHYQMKMK
jgi:hypothetical protein